MQSDLQIEGPLLNQAAVCEIVLRGLPEWFGIEAAIGHYLDTVASLPTWIGRVGGQTAGFLSIKPHFPASAEIYVMGVRREFHRQGVGRELVKAAEGWLAAQGTLYLQVKTLGAGREDANYARTRAFYSAVGFCPLEEFLELWDAHNPCLLMVKKLTGSW